MNGNDTDTLDDEGQDQASPIVAPPAQPAITPPAMPPRNAIYTGPNVEPFSSVQVGPPSVSAAPFLANIGRVQDELAAQRMIKEARSDPDLEASTAAIEAATRFQGQRGYQRDLEAGMSAPDAMAKWGPMLFFQSRGSAMSPAGLASNIRAQQPTIRTVGQGLYRISPEGTATAIVEPPSRLSGEERVQDEDLRDRISALRRKASDTTNTLPEDRAQAEREAATLVEQRKALYRKRGTTTGTQRVIKDKSGKSWIYRGTMANPRQDRNPANWQQSG